MQVTKDNRLGTENITRLMISLAIPSVLAQIVNVLYNIVDRIYIGRIPGVGAVALTGVGVTFPIITIISAFSGFASGGGAPLAAIALGQGDRKRAERILGNCVSMLLFFTVILMVFFFVFRKPLLYVFGASDNTIGYSSTYISIYLLGTVFVELAVGLNTFISAQGQARTAMFSVLIGAVVNIVLDPIFIFVFHMGVAGAAVATIISQALSAAWVLHFLCSGKIRNPSEKGRHEAGFFPDRPDHGPWRVALCHVCHGERYHDRDEPWPAGLRGRPLCRFHDDSPERSAAGFRADQRFYQRRAAIISYNFGAGKFDRVKMTIKRMISITFLAAFVYVVFAMLRPGLFARLFTTDEDLIALVKKVLPVYIAGMSVFGVQSGVQSSFLGLGQAKISLCIALLRKVILLIPLALILPRFFGVMGVYYAEPVADILSVLTASTLFLLNIRKILSKEMLAKVTHTT